MRYCTLLMVAGAVLTVGAAQAQTPPAPASASPGPPPVTAMVMMAAVMPSADFERSRAFYVKGMGMKADTGANPRELVLSFPGGGANVMLTAAANPAAPPRPPGRAILQVPDLKGLVARLAAAGYPLKGRITENAQYRILIANVEDPDGNAFEIIQRGP